MGGRGSRFAGSRVRKLGPLKQGVDVLPPGETSCRVVRVADVDEPGVRIHALAHRAEVVRVTFRQWDVDCSQSEPCCELRHGVECGISSTQGNRRGQARN